MSGHTDGPIFDKLIIHFDEPHRGPRGERLFVVEDGEGHQLILLQPLAELGDGETFEYLARLIAAAPDTAEERDSLRTHAEALAGNLEEAIRILTFAFEGALPEETVMGLTIDPYGTVNDMRTALTAYREGSGPSLSEENKRLREALRILETRCQKTFVGDSGSLGEQEATVCIFCGWSEPSHFEACPFTALAAGEKGEARE